MKKILILLAASLAAGSAYAGTLETLKSSGDLSAVFSAAQKCGAADIGDSVPMPGQPRPAFPQPKPAGAVCVKPEVSIDAAGNLYLGHALLGRGAAEFKTGCTGNVAWLDKSGYLHKNSTLIGRDVREYLITAFTGDVVWADRYSYLYKNSARLGSDTEKYEANAFSGGVVWTDRGGYLYRNGSAGTDRIGSGVREYKVSVFTGDTAWKDNFGSLYKNSGGITSRLGGDVTKYSIAARTGIVAWLDDAGTLFVNGLPFARGVSDYKLDAFGLASWTDPAGTVHAV